MSTSIEVFFVGTIDVFPPNRNFFLSHMSISFQIRLPIKASAGWAQKAEIRKSAERMSPQPPSGVIPPPGSSFLLFLHPSSRKQEIFTPFPSSPSVSFCLRSTSWTTTSTGATIRVHTDLHRYHRVPPRARIVAIPPTSKTTKKLRPGAITTLEETTRRLDGGRCLPSTATTVSIWV